MIEINLLPESLRTFPEKEMEKARSESLLKKGVFKFVAGGVGIFLLIYLLFILAPVWFFYSGRYSYLNSEWNKIKDDFSKIDAVLTKEKKMLAMETVLNSQKKESQVWPRILNAVSDAVPLNVRLTSVKDEAAQEFVVETVITMEDGKKVEKEQKNAQIGKILVINGNYASSEDDEATIDLFLNNLKEQRIFKDKFQKIELQSLSSIEDGRKGFLIKCWFKRTEGRKQKSGVR